MISEALKYWEDLTIPTTYQTQLELGPGDYELELAITDGEKFGRATALLRLDSLVEDHLAISSIALCKRYRRASVGPRPPTQAPQYVPLVAKGMEFTPAGDSRFKKGEPLIAFLEIHGSQIEGATPAKISLEMKISDAKTNELKIGTGIRSVDSDTLPGSLTIPVAWDVGADKLPPGSYLLELQASDFAGNKTPWRSATFSVE
jgi:hypothetical protein